MLARRGPCRAFADTLAVTKRSAVTDAVAEPERDAELYAIAHRRAHPVTQRHADAGADRNHPVLASPAP